MKPAKVALLGGFGLMAEAALHDLAANPSVGRILAVDLNLSRAKAVLAKIPNRRKIAALKLDLSDRSAAVRKLRGCDVVLNCAWYEYNVPAMELALALKAHYVDLGGLFHTTLKQLKLSPRFAKIGRCAVLGCGSTPGITNMMVARMADSFETIDTVGIYDASYDPALSDSTFLPPFSIRTMLAEYEQPAPVFKNGRIKEVPAHSEPEELEFKPPIGRMTCGAVIHSEAATLPGYLKDKGVKNLFFKIAYPESVKSQLGMLVAMGLSKDEPIRLNGKTLVSPRHFVTALSQAAAASAPAGAPNDFEILRVRVTGSRHGRAIVKVWDCELRAAKPLSAGAMGVGFAGAIAASMTAARQTRVPAGAGAPESILDHDVFFRELRRRKIFTLVETIAHPLAI